MTLSVKFGTGHRIINKQWIDNLTTNTTKGIKMFKKIRAWFCKELSMDHKYFESSYKVWKEEIHKSIANLEEELHIHKKLTNSPKFVTIISRASFYGRPDNFSSIIDKNMQPERDVLTKKGYKYFHTKHNGDEVWVEDPSFVAPVKD